MHLVKKPRQVFFDNNFKGKHTGYIFMSSRKCPTKDITKTQINLTSIYFNKNYYDNQYLNCINFVSGYKDDDEMYEYINTKYNINFDSVVLYSVAKKIIIYLIIVDFNSELAFKKHIIMDLYESHINDTYESIVNKYYNSNKCSNMHLKKQITNSKDCNVNIKINLLKVYKILIGL